MTQEKEQDRLKVPDQCIVLVYSQDGRCAIRAVGPFPNRQQAMWYAREASVGYQIWSLAEPPERYKGVEGEERKTH